MKLDDLTDVTISNIQDNDLVIYDTATQQWLNTPASHIAVTSFNGITGPVQGVSSFQGKTGDVGISAGYSKGEGITWSMVGNTYAFGVHYTTAVGITSTTVLDFDSLLLERKTSGQMYRINAKDFFTNIASTGIANAVDDPTGQNFALSGNAYISYDNLEQTIIDQVVTTFNGNTGDVQGVSSWNGQTGAVQFHNYVSSFNGVTGAVQGVSAVNGQTGEINISVGQGITISQTPNGISLAVNWQFGGQTVPGYSAVGVDFMLLQRKGTGGSGEMYLHNIANLFQQFVPQYIPIPTRDETGASPAFSFVMTGGGGDTEVTFADQIALISASLTTVDGGTFA
jgi:hypothetical protein